MARYIARHNGLYPAVPLDAWRNDWVIEQHGEILKNFGFMFKFGKAHKEGRANLLNVVLAGFINKIKPFISKGGWIIGDGSQI